MKQSQAPTAKVWNVSVVDNNGTDLEWTNGEFRIELIYDHDDCPLYMCFESDSDFAFEAAESFDTAKTWCSYEK